MLSFTVYVIIISSVACPWLRMNLASEKVKDDV